MSKSSRRRKRRANQRANVQHFQAEERARRTGLQNARDGAIAAAGLGAVGTAGYLGVKGKRAIDSTKASALKAAKDLTASAMPLAKQAEATMKEYVKAGQKVQGSVALQSPEDLGKIFKKIIKRRAREGKVAIGRVLQRARAAATLSPGVVSGLSKLKPMAFDGSDSGSIEFAGPGEGYHIMPDGTRMKNSDMPNYNSPTKKSKRKIAAETAAIAGGALVGGGAVGSALLYGGNQLRTRPMRPGEDLTGKRIARRHGAAPIFQHIGVGVGKGQVVDVVNNPFVDGPGKVVQRSLPDFRAPMRKDGGRGAVANVRVFRGKRGERSEAVAARAKGMVGRKLKYNLVNNNCETGADCASTGKWRKGKLSSQGRRGLGGLAVGGVLGGVAVAKGIKGRRKDGKYELASQRLADVLYFGQAGQARDGQNRFRNPVLAVSDGDVLAVPQAARYIHRKAKGVERSGRRIKALADDAAAVVRGAGRQRDSAGRLKPREWERPWFKRAVTTAALTAGGLGAMVAVKRNPKIGGKTIQRRMNEGIAAGRAAMPKWARGMVGDQRFPDPTVVSQSKPRIVNSKGRNRKPKSDNPDNIININASRKDRAVRYLAERRKDWEIQRISAKQARVAAPGSQRRQRREKRPLEKIENERKLKNAMIVGALLAGAGGGFAAGRKMKLGKLKAAKRPTPAGKKNLPPGDDKIINLPGA